MSQQEQIIPWFRGLLRPTWKRAGVLLCLALLWMVYHLYLTPQKRAARHRLSEAETKSRTAIDTRLKPLSELFANGRKGAKGFAEEALSWKGKWKLIKGTILWDDSHREYLSEAFARHVFSNSELRDAMQAAVNAYLDDVEGFESEMLVQLRIDLANSAGSIKSLPANFRGEEELRKEYRRFSGVLARELNLDLGVTVGREIGILVASELAAQLTLQAAKAAAVEMGVNAGVLSSGAVSTAATLGVGLIIAIIIDAVLEEVFKMAGHDPVAKIEKLVCQSLDKIEAALLADPGIFSFEKRGSLRERMEQLHECNAKLRQATIARLLKGGE
jgi:hypothetical protein